MSDEKNKPGQIPTQSAIPWSVALSVSWAGLRRRVLRALITVLGIVLNGLSPRRIAYYSNYRYYRSYKKYYGSQT